MSMPQLFFPLVLLIIFRNVCDVIGHNLNLGILFFETNPGTQLSTELVENTFGNLVYNSQPNYIPEYIKSFTNLNSYLIIFATSFFAVVSLCIPSSLSY